MIAVSRQRYGVEKTYQVFDFDQTTLRGPAEKSVPETVLNIRFTRFSMVSIEQAEEVLEKAVERGKLIEEFYSQGQGPYELHLQQEGPDYRLDVVDTGQGVSYRLMRLDGDVEVLTESDHVDAERAREILGGDE